MTRCAHRAGWQRRIHFGFLTGLVTLAATGTGSEHHGLPPEAGDTIARFERVERSELPPADVERPSPDDLDAFLAELATDPSWVIFLTFGEAGVEIESFATSDGIVTEI